MRIPVGLEARVFVLEMGFWGSTREEFTAARFPRVDLLALLVLTIGFSILCIIKSFSKRRRLEQADSYCTVYTPRDYPSRRVIDRTFYFPTRPPNVVVTTPFPFTRLAPGIRQRVYTYYLADANVQTCSLATVAIETGESFACKRKGRTILSHPAYWDVDPERFRHGYAQGGMRIVVHNGRNIKSIGLGALGLVFVSRQVSAEVLGMAYRDMRLEVSVGRRDMEVQLRWPGLRGVRNLKIVIEAKVIEQLARKRRVLRSQREGVTTDATSLADFVNDFVHLKVLELEIRVTDIKEDTVIAWEKLFGCLFPCGIFVEK